MQVTIAPGRARGAVQAPPSKSMAHRLLIAAGLSRGTSTVRGVAPCEDVLATLDCLRALGADCRMEGDCVTVRGTDVRSAVPCEPLRCRESGSTLRFLVPIALLTGARTRFLGAPSLLRRPMGVYETLCRERGFLFEASEENICVRGRLTADTYVLPGNISSQFITGLLFALPLVEGDSEICLLPPVESRSYIDLTLSALQSFGIVAAWKNDTTLAIRGGQTYTAREITVEGDYSNAAFLEALGVFGGDVTVCGLVENSLQGDCVYRAHFEALRRGTPTISLGDCPDLGPILFTLAAAQNGAVFTETARLRIKESDRVACVAQELGKFGAKLSIEPDRVTVRKVPLHAPNAPLESHNDHRIAMSMAVLATRYGGTLQQAEAVAKSFPNFFEDLVALGIQVQSNLI